MTPTLPDSRVTVWQPLPPREGSGESMSRQAFALTRPEREIAFVSARGAGKTQALFLFLLRLAIAKDENGKLLYPNYRGLLVRRHSKDLQPTLDDAEKIFGPMGARRVGRVPAVFEFPDANGKIGDGPKIFSDHLDDVLSWQQKQGHEYHKIAIEEANQLASEELYLLLLGSMRMSPDNNPQVMLTGNWGDVGDIWLKRRFVKVRKPDGSMCEPMKPIKDLISGHCTIYIPASPEDNSILMAADPGYLKYLETLPEPKRSAWRFGDPEAYAGQFFTEFRPNGPYAGDPPNANHVIDSAELPTWCFRWGSMDWGHKHYGAAYKFCVTPDERVHCYDEMVERGIGSFMWGVNLAKWWMSDLQRLPSGRITLYLSHDAFQQRDEGNTIAERIAAGIDAVLGERACYLAHPTELERQQAFNNPHLAAELIRGRAEECATRIGINLEKAASEPGSRKKRADYVRELMRFKSVELGLTFDPEYAKSLLRHANGELLYNEYLNKFQPQKPEVLPKLQIWRSCPIIIETIPILKPDVEKGQPEAVAKFDATENDMGDDPWDGFSYGLVGHRNYVERPPKEYVIGEKLDQARKMGMTDINLLAQVAKFHDKKYDESDEDLRPLTLNRLSMPWMGPPKRR